MSFEKDTHPNTYAYDDLDVQQSKCEEINEEFDSQNPTTIVRGV